MRLFLGMTLLAVSLAGCATEAKYNKQLDSWVGRPADDLIIAWGPPDSVYELRSGNQILQYEQEWVEEEGGYTHYEDVETTTYGKSKDRKGHKHKYVERSTTEVPVTEPVTYSRYSCTTRFVLTHDALIQEWSHEGECRSD